MKSGAPVVFEELSHLVVGTSPFRVKGHVYLKMREDVEQRVGNKRFLDRVAQDDLRAFWEQRFLAGGWYDALPMMPLTLAHARLVGVPLHQFCRDKGMIIASRDVPGIYRALLRLFSPETLMARLPRASMFYFDFGVPRLTWREPNLVRTSLDAVPCTLAPMLAGIIEGFLGTALELAGTRGVVVRTLEVLYDGGVRASVPTAGVRHEVSWTRT